MRDERWHTNLLEGAPLQRPLAEFRAHCRHVVVCSPACVAEALAELRSFIGEARDTATQVLQGVPRHGISCIEICLGVGQLHAPLLDRLRVTVALGSNLLASGSHCLVDLVSQFLHPALGTSLSRGQGFRGRSLDPLGQLRAHAGKAGVKAHRGLVEPLLELFEDLALQNLLTETGRHLGGVLARILGGLQAKFLDAALEQVLDHLSSICCCGGVVARAGVHLPQRRLNGFDLVLDWATPLPLDCSCSLLSHLCHFGVQSGRCFPHAGVDRLGSGPQFPMDSLET
mmetsp:Transcript_43376/g.120593  ORF Transcript_43376/g.120593 Transcript_43376/m.120593 type:complete len:285 (+) Transcript_43376:409-1263(+)